MRLFTPAVRVLFGKELRQLLRNRQALTTSALLPFILQVLVPGVQLVALTQAARRGTPISAGAAPGLSGATTLTLFALFLVPLFVCLSATIAPGVTAVVAIVNERERRTMELLVALPVRVTEIVTSKLAATVVASGVVTVPLALLDGIVGMVAGHQPPVYVLFVLLLVVGGMCCSVGTAAGVSMLARDYRTAQQLTGLIVLPVGVIASAVLTLVPGVWRLLVLAILLIVIGALTAWVVARRFSFERYLN
jgi:ABC-2 type transport system permease protein